MGPDNALVSVTGAPLFVRIAPTPAGLSLTRAAPALLAFLGVRMLGLGVLAAFAAAQARSAHELLVKWDGQWYAAIAQNGYGFVRIHQDGRHLADYAFFPLYPMLEKLLARATGLGYLDAGLLISALSSLVAAWGIFAVADHVGGRGLASTVTLLWAVLPIGIVQFMAYSESLFTAFAAWSLYAVLTNQWVWAGVLASGAGLTRPIGVSVAAAVLIPASLALIRRRRSSATAEVPQQAPIRRPWGALLAPLGWSAFVIWVGISTGSATGYFDVAAGWQNGFDGGVAFTRWEWNLLVDSSPLGGAAILCAVILLAALLITAHRHGQPLPLLIFSAVLLFLAFTTSGYFGSKPRYLLPGFTLLMPVAAWMARLPPTARVAILTTLAAGSAVYGAIWLLGPGPP